MGKIRVAINGFGRIGRVFTRSAINFKNIELVAINDLVDTKTLSHLLKYDSVHGKLNHDISSQSNLLTIGDNEVKVYSEKDPENLPWKELDIDIVIESTGFFRSLDTASKHLTAGAKKSYYFCSSNRF
jgi:glyceraldehyde 3-phosphate dehydrogenase